jgi:hypothetical protein
MGDLNEVFPEVSVGLAAQYPERVLVAGKLFYRAISGNIKISSVKNYSNLPFKLFPVTRASTASPCMTTMCTAEACKEGRCMMCVTQLLMLGARPLKRTAKKCLAMLSLQPSTAISLLEVDSFKTIIRSPSINIYLHTIL